jgi:hypothetical protein
VLWHIALLIIYYQVNYQHEMKKIDNLLNKNQTTYLLDILPTCPNYSKRIICFRHYLARVCYRSSKKFNSQYSYILHHINHFLLQFKLKKKKITTKNIYIYFSLFHIKYSYFFLISINLCYSSCPLLNTVTVQCRMEPSFKKKLPLGQLKNNHHMS